MLHDYGPEFDIDPHSPPSVNEVGSECILRDRKGSKDSESEVVALREKLKEKFQFFVLMSTSAVVQLPFYLLNHM